MAHADELSAGRRWATGLVRRSAIASTFAASLELVRAGKIQLRQEIAFGPIYLRSPARTRKTR